MILLEEPAVSVQQEGIKLYVEVKNGNLDRALRVLKKKLAEDGLFNVLRQKQYYEKPTDKRRREKRAALVRHRREQRERQE